jgi:hypothetical protein
VSQASKLLCERSQRWRSVPHRCAGGDIGVRHVRRVQMALVPTTNTQLR